MKKEKIQDILKVMPDILKNVGNYVKDSFDKNGQEALDNANGVVGILIKLFAQDCVDKYFDKKTNNKLKDFGLATYLKAALLQAGKSINETISENETCINTNDNSISTHIQDIISAKFEKFEINNTITIFQPKYHPIMQFIKNSVKQIFLEFGFTSSLYNSFLKNFNENIENTVINTFGQDAYKKHKEEVQQFIMNEREAEFLSDMFALNKIGFKDEENLKYEDTYGQWENISKLYSPNPLQEYDSQHNDFIRNTEPNQLLHVEDLIEKYYKSKDKITLREIVFIIADFGKGKSVFLRHYASKLAKEYIESLDGYFPIYFNLRNFKNYQSNTTAGIIAEFLRKDYGIEITSDEFKNKKYIFLIDSLDESGELNKHTIDNVISSIKEIQNIDPTCCRNNRIIITSRPFEDGLNTHIKNSLPYTDKDKIQYFISVHGFTKEQFNDWITNSIKDYLQKHDIKTNDFTKKIVDNVKNNKKIDIYALLIKNNTLTQEELKRPIFAYMIYQLIINNIDFSTIGKTGVYLSFLNLLTKEAKHMEDADCQFNLQEEIESRNILHSIAALWMYEKQQGKHGTLKKADIFRVLEGKKINDNDAKVLEDNINSNVSDIKFLSHSYFGAKDDLLHFQHQSFAEMLLAEYYLKIFIKYALDDGIEIEDARILLNLGEPTEQTISFFKELLQLLKNSCSSNEKEKRNLLFPLLASLATEKHNKRIRCNSLFYEWLKPVKLDNLTSYPNELIDNWCINDEKLLKIIELSKSILESKKEYLTAKSNTCKALFDNEVLAIEDEKLNRIPHNIDKWLALLVGNILKNDEKNKIFFNASIRFPVVFFNMMKDWFYSYNIAVPKWANGYLKGINTSKNKERILAEYLKIDNVDFSFSIFNNISFNYCFIINSYFNNCSFINTDIFIKTFRTTFHNITTIENSRITFDNDILPVELMCNFLPENIGIGESRKAFITSTEYAYWSNKQDFMQHNVDIEEIFSSLQGFFVYGLKQKTFTVQEIIDAYEYNSEETKELFSEKVKALVD
ncbi:MAG: hypothetical protein H6Q35_814 [Proteobacteria bacterium]|nr:hypothetical protein [Pseudomonadota bacterium]